MNLRPDGPGDVADVLRIAGTDGHPAGDDGRFTRAAPFTVGE
jgi:hypothetical protein